MSSENTEYFRTKAFIFDLDGTLIDTTPLVERHWHRFADENGLDGNKAKFEKKLADEWEGVSILPGITTLLQKVPSNKWGIFTSSSEYMTKKRLEQCHLPTPHSVVCGDTVERGKPDPEGYVRAARELGFEGKDVIVFEDAPAGIKSARDAGATVIACATTHTVDQLKQAGANCVVSLLTEIDFTILPDGSFEVQVKNTL
ncbi:hypothetical protein HPULCUR_004199 [Helicostylum pulchrum]|uniref:Uncharacterized protein n=1 Tax=Helicostylum pulchrum TaxID=562976 RepID=A0ABP9XVK1_9FUNG